MPKLLLPLLSLLFLLGCKTRQKNSADYILHNAKIYTVDAEFSMGQAMAVKDGKILEVGTNQDILSKYKASQSYDALGKTVLPGLIDAHAHFYGFGSMLQNADLAGLDSWEAVLDVLQDFSKSHSEGWLVGRGWDQNRWTKKEFPSKEKLDQMFPDRPVYLTRVDGHAAIVNQKALDIAGYNLSTKMSGGDLLKKDGKLTGVLIDNAKDQMATHMPKPTKAQVQQILRQAQEYSFKEGLTTVVDAGLDFPLVEEIEAMQKSEDLKINLHVMLSDSEANFQWLKSRGIIKTDRLFVNGMKFYADGALGSRGACLLHPYSDEASNTGFLLSDVAHFKKMASLLFEEGFQMNTHAIGDSANRVILEVYANELKGKNDRRWRIEHAQVISPEDFSTFAKYSIVPSVQPTHATSDMPWAESRLGKERLSHAYANKQLLNQNGWLVLGTDFPVEDISPMKTFYAAVVRKDAKGFPSEGFQMQNALSRVEALKGMTLWAAKGSFQENEKGSLEKGKWADFIVLDQDILKIEPSKILETKVLKTYVKGELVMDYESLKSSLKAGN
ncbi:amidohydrolase [Chryseobacterium sp. A301]